jgi:hypothetical protein
MSSWLAQREKGREEMMLKKKIRIHLIRSRIYVSVATGKSGRTEAHLRKMTGNFMLSAAVSSFSGLSQRASRRHNCNPA